MHAAPAPTAAYLYILSLDGPGLAWEYLRRNASYAADWTRATGGSASPHAALWGLRTLEDPAVDARDADVDWLPDPDAVVGLGPAVRDDDDPFSLWAIPGRKSLVHDGKRLLLRTRLGRRVVRIAVALTLQDGAPYAFAVPPMRQRRARAAAEEVAAALAGVAEPRRAAGLSRSQLVHMRALQALDAERAGASEREIGAIVLDQPAAGTAWNDSAARAQVRYLLKHGRSLRDGGYRHLLRADLERGAAERRNLGTAEPPS